MKPSSWTPGMLLFCNGWHDGSKDSNPEWAKANPVKWSAGDIVVLAKVEPTNNGAWLEFEGKVSKVWEKDFEVYPGLTPIDNLTIFRAAEIRAAILDGTFHTGMLREDPQKA